MSFPTLDRRAREARPHASPRLWLAACIVGSTVLLTGCGGGSSGPDTQPEGTPGTAKATLVRVAVEAAGTHCPAGGTRIESGPDTDANGVLADGEVSATQYVCNGVNGAAGSDGRPLLVRVRAEAAGANCAQGGSAVLAGQDVNGNGVLDADEAGSVAYVCHGATGSAGLDALVALAAEPVGTNCPYGGQRVQSGGDANRNGVLDAGEVTTTAYLCSAAPADTRWLNVTGPSVQAESNTGYLANAAASVAITLPLSPVIGDWIKVTGVGSGGWTIAQNAGQRISTVGLPGGNTIDWTTAGSPTATWSAVSLSTDGASQVAVGALGELYTSGDRGAHWTLRLTGQPWSGVAMSAAGNRLLAASNGGALFTSSDGGGSWVNDGSSRAWSAVASSADGLRLVATAYLGQIWTSSDGGGSWVARESSRAWRTVSASADGRVLVAGTNGGQLYVSSDYGASWTPRASAAFWWGTAVSSDGKRQYATVDTGAIWRSDDFGVTWEAVSANRDWRGIATSSDGRYVVATTSGGLMYESVDGGLTWRATADGGAWSAVASSADGQTLLASKSGAGLYAGLRRPTTTPGVAGSLSGGQGDTLHLQYVGGGLFLPISFVSASPTFTAR
ncbi:MAG: hypothetical protein J7598_13575 [Mitsuaria chitosanitabida]|uniref:WD40/YVTN/BNR-like repeat-containing protein n=1 Tax=Roseateles chitosanitabidus TaxID=65048 RepID=UPI001B13B5CE|nr:hypothetical protein [Roseateles chitosanitabidus]MBO9687630.1 hypothetical protein [Roseateles chitosanitabidus]